MVVHQGRAVDTWITSRSQGKNPAGVQCTKSSAARSPYWRGGIELETASEKDGSKIAGSATGVAASTGNVELVTSAAVAFGHSVDTDDTVSVAVSNALSS